MNPVPMDELDERQRAEAESQVRRARARLEIIRAQVGPRVEARKAERNRAAWKEHAGMPIPGRGTREALFRPKPVSSPVPVPLGRHVPAPWVTHGISEPQYSRQDKRQMWAIWALVALGCALYVGLVLWRLW